MIDGEQFTRNIDNGQCWWPWWEETEKEYKRTRSTAGQKTSKNNPLHKDLGHSWMTIYSCHHSSPKTEYHERQSRERSLWIYLGGQGILPKEIGLRWSLELYVGVMEGWEAQGHSRWKERWEQRHWKLKESCFVLSGAECVCSWPALLQLIVHSGEW